MVHRRFTLGFAVVTALVVASGHYTGDSEDEVSVAAIQFTDSTYIQSTPAAKPTCDATTLGTVLFEQDTDAAGAVGTYNVCRKDGGAATYAWVDALAGGGGGVSGSGTDNRIVRWDGTSNVQDSLVTIADTTGDILPVTDSTQDIGGNGTEWASVWTDTIANGNNIVLQKGGTTRATIVTEGIQLATAHDLRCAGDNSCDVGASAAEFGTVWVETIDDSDGTISVGANVVPAADNTHALGGASLGWDYMTLTDNAAVTPVTCDDTTEGTLYYKSDSNGSVLCLCMRTGGGSTFAGTAVLDVGGPAC